MTLEHTNMLHLKGLKMKKIITLIILLAGLTFGQSSTLLLLMGDGATAHVTPPSAPTNLSAVGGTGEVVFTRTDPTAADLDSIIVYGGTSTDPTTPIDTIDAGIQSYTKDGLAEGAVYYVRLKAQDVTGNLSAYTSTVSDTATTTTLWYVGSCL